MTTLSAFLDGTVDLQCHDVANGLIVYKWSDGQLSYRREEAEPSNFVKGQTYTAHAPNNPNRQVGVRVKGNSYAQYVTRRDAMFAAFAQTGYSFTIAYDGTTISAWVNCAPAEYETEEGGMTNRFGLLAAKPWQEYVFTFPSTP